ncbi:hypothetical protein HUJ04_000334 [Dendroctonus ponderosae]|nr:hypothetical protein HUJ04_000334 [Dendroctonus ponderosae]
MSELNRAAASRDAAKTAFSVLQVQFPVATDRLRTLDFLEAAHGLVTIVERFGKVFAPVINDMNGNIKKLRNRYEEDCASHAHLEEMILREQVEGGMVATDALLWLRRALHFLSQFFECIIMDSESERATQDLVPMMQQAYSETLEPYHGWLGTQLFNASPPPH